MERVKGIEPSCQWSKMVKSGGLPKSGTTDTGNYARTSTTIKFFGHGRFSSSGIILRRPWHSIVYGERRSFHQTSADLIPPLFKFVGEYNYGYFPAIR